MTAQAPARIESTRTIATCMHGIPTRDADGLALHDAAASAWTDVFGEIAALGFTAVELADSHLRIADADAARTADIFAAANEAGIVIPSVHVQRRSILMPGAQAENLDYAHRTIDAAARLGIGVFSTGLHRPLTQAQKNALWFWLEPGEPDAADPEAWDLAVRGFRELGEHAQSVGMRMSLEMYEDTLLGTADSAVSLVEQIGVPAVGLNPDVGNLVRLHRTIEDWREVYAKTLPYANYWHLKNYIRDEAGDGSWHSAVPSTLEGGLINYRQVIKDAIALGYDGVFLMEHYGGDSLGVCRTNAQYTAAVLDSLVGSSVTPLEVSP
jgi:sugar phosphate isomerase/epimerase